MTIHNALAAIAIRTAKDNDEIVIDKGALAEAVHEFNRVVRVALTSEGAVMHDFHVSPSESSLRGKVLPLVAEMLDLTIEKAGREMVIVLDRERFDAGRSSQAGSAQAALEALAKTFDGASVAGCDFNSRGLAQIVVEDLCDALGVETHAPNGRNSTAYKFFRESLKALAEDRKAVGDDSFTCRKVGKTLSFSVYADLFDAA